MLSIFNSIFPKSQRFKVYTSIHHQQNYSSYENYNYYYDASYNYSEYGNYPGNYSVTGYNFPFENPTVMTALSAQIKDVNWLLKYETVIKALPIPLCILAIISSIIAYVIASNLKSDQASVTVLKYMAALDAIHALDMMQSILLQISC